MTRADNHQIQTERLGETVVKHLKASGTDICRGVEKNASTLIDWINHLRQSESTEIANELLNGTQAAIIEVAGCLSLGFVRPAIFSMRAEIDMLLSWLFFKDHPIEWRYVQETGEGFKLKSELMKYLEEYIPRFKERFALLRQVKKRKENDPYKLLSAHVHSQSISATPAVSNLDSLVAPNKRCHECIAIQAEVTEYLNDILFSCYADKWVSLPKSILDKTKSRMANPQQRAFFA